MSIVNEAGEDVTEAVLDMACSTYLGNCYRAQAKPTDQGLKEFLERNSWKVTSAHVICTADSWVVEVQAAPLIGVLRKIQGEPLIADAAEVAGLREHEERKT
jgi:hypothetical protein